MKTKDNSIELIRVVAMLLIIFDHIFAYIDIPYKSLILQIANSGTLIFLFISGYLYGKKIINNWKKWFLNRVLRVCLPVWIFMVVDIVVESVLWNNFSIKYIFIYLFNLQGIFGGTLGGYQLWFLTILMICYLMTPLLQFIKTKNNTVLIRNLLIMMPISQIIFAYLLDIGMVGNHSISWCIGAVFIYLVGYLLGDKVIYKEQNYKKILHLTVISLITASIVTVIRLNFDGTVIYEKIIFFYGMVLVDYWICIILYRIGEIIKNDNVVNILSHISGISYDIYIVHNLVILAITLPLIGQKNVLIYILLTIFISYVFAYVLNYICKITNKIIIKKLIEVNK